MTGGDKRKVCPLGREGEWRKCFLFERVVLESTVKRLMEVNLAELGYLRAGVAVPELRVADVDFNTAEIERLVIAASHEGCRLLAFPELCLTGYTCGDLFYQEALLRKAEGALLKLAAVTDAHPMTVVVGLPLLADSRLYNCAAVLAEGRVVGIVPKLYLPNSREFYEERWFSRGEIERVQSVEINGMEVAFGPDMIFRAEGMRDFSIGIEICEDLWTVNPPSGNLALAEATVIINLSASNELLGKQAYRRELVRQQSARCLAAYLYASAGPGESTTDVVYSGAGLIYDNGRLLAETERFQFSSQLALADIDLQHLAHERIQNSSFSADSHKVDYTTQWLTAPPPIVKEHLPLRRPVPQLPFVPSDPAERAANCKEIVTIQAMGLAKRLRHIGAPKAVIGISGGLDSTLALLVTLKAMEFLERATTEVVALTMPGLGTTDRTKDNATLLAEQLGVTFRTIPIGDAVQQHFHDIGHPTGQYDVTYENAQARERTQILMDVANQVGGIVVGTGDLSEAALGWSTFNGDHMSMYHVNVGVPKTLVRYLIDWMADEHYSGEVRRILHDITETPITPELLPLDVNAELAQKTEDTIGPYALHDFFLFHCVRNHFAPAKIAFLASQAFQGTYSEQEILRWLTEFYRRFFGSQFKRNSMPDGPKVGSVALSPRGDWRMPSDAVASLWLDELRALQEPA